MTDPIRTALERLIELNDHPDTECAAWNDAVEVARAALAAVPEGEGPPAVTISALLHPAYEPGDGSADGAQIVGMQWWHPVMGCDSLQLVVDNARNILRSRWARPAAPPADLPPDYIDEWITNPRDRALLEVFLKACNAEGGSADEVILRGLKAVLQDGLSRSHRLQQENHRFREPERTILCDILANGTLLPDPDGTRYGIPPAPLEGEVGELVAALRSTADGLESQAYPQTAALITRAADLLEQRHPAPVPVSERLPGPEEMDGSLVWCGSQAAGLPYWEWCLDDIRHPGSSGYTHWLPANTPALPTALPLPQGEVE